MGDATRRLGDLLNILLEADREMAVISAEDPYRFYELLHQKATLIAQTDAFYICLYSATNKTLYFPYNFDSGIYDEPLTIPLGNGPTSWVISNNKPFVLDERNKATQNGNISFGDMDRKSRSAIHVPMRAGVTGIHEQIIGVLSVQSYKSNAYNLNDVQALQWLADRAGMKLQRDRDAATVRRIVTFAETRAVEQHEQAVLMADQFVSMLTDISLKAEALRALIPKDNPALQNAANQLCRECNRRQTEANQLPLLTQHQTPPEKDAVTD